MSNDIIWTFRDNKNRISKGTLEECIDQWIQHHNEDKQEND